MENNRPILPIKLPPNQRKKLSLLIDAAHESSQEKEVNETKTDLLSDESKLNDEENRFSSDNNAYFVENLENNSDENEHDSTTTTEDSNSYFALNDFISKDISISTNSDISNDISNSTLNQTASDDDDEEEDKYYVPCGLIIEPEAITPVIEHVPIQFDTSNTNFTTNIKPAHPTLPKKMSKKEFQMNSRQFSMTSNKSDDSVYYCPPSVLQLSTFDAFKREIFKNNNKLCADCQTNLASHLSCKYFITLCDKCSETHLKLPHHVNKFYIIDIKTAYNELIKSSVDVSIESVLKILAESGNEKMNSLFEFESNQQKRIDNIDEFIKEKYLYKNYINQNEIDFSTNYIEISNETFAIQGLCIPILIYNLFIGANINYLTNTKTVYDTACEFNQISSQVNYLKLNNAFRFSEINQSILDQEFEGELLQVFDMNPTIQSATLIKNLKKFPLKLNLNKKSIKLVKNKAKTEIDYFTLIKIESHLKCDLIEVKWCNKMNNSLMSTYFEYSCANEKNIWMREFYSKMISQLNPISLFETNETKQTFLNLINLIHSCQINLIGYLNLNKYESIESDREEGQLVAACLIETLNSQMSEFFHRKLVLIASTEINVIDLRKIRIKLKDNLIRIDYENKCFVLKSQGYFQNLKTWYEAILAKSQMDNLTINDQYLTKENVPVFIEKVCSYVEFNFVLDKRYYSSASLTKPTKPFNLSKLIKEKELTPILENPLCLLKQFFSTYFTSKHTSVFIKSWKKFFDKSIEPYLNDYLMVIDFCNKKITYSSLVEKNDLETENLNRLVNVEKLKSFMYKQSQMNPIFYYTLRRIAIHLNLISTYKDKNEMNEEYLSLLFAPILFNTTNLNSIMNESLENLNLNIDYSNESIPIYLFGKLIQSMSVNCTYVFNLKENYLKTQLKMIDRSFELNKINLTKINPDTNLDSKYLITIYYESKKSEKLYHLKIDSESTPQSLIDSLDDLKNLTNLRLFEVFDNEQYKSFASRYHSTDKLVNISLVRLLPSNLKLINNLSRWNSFYLCLKQQNEKIESAITTSFSENTYETCEFIIQCKNCGLFNLNQNLSTDCSAHKWKNAYLMIQNDTIKFYKRNTNDTTTNQEDYLKLKHFCEIKLEDLIFYYGLYYWSDTLANNKNWQIPNEIKINEDECVSLFDKHSNLLYSIHFKDSTTCLSFYKDLFEKLYKQNCAQMSLFINNSVPRSVFVWTSEFNFYTNSISRIFKKIIKK